SLIDKFIELVEELISTEAKLRVTREWMDQHYGGMPSSESKKEYFHRDDDLRTVMQTNRKLLHLAKDMRDLSVSLNRIVASHSFTERFKSICEICTQIYVMEGGFMVLLGVPSHVAIPADDPAFAFPEVSLSMTDLREKSGSTVEEFNE